MTSPEEAWEPPAKALGLLTLRCVELLHLSSKEVNSAVRNCARKSDTALQLQNLTVHNNNNIIKEIR